MEDLRGAYLGVVMGVTGIMYTALLSRGLDVSLRSRLYYTLGLGATYK